MRQNTFGAVKASIDKLAGNLKDEQADEVKQKDWCVDSLNENSRETTSKTDHRDDTQTKLDDMTSTINTLNDDIAGLKAEITDMQTEIKKASQAREAENHEFQMTVMDQRATQAVLQKAIDRLNKFYARQLFLMQQRSALASAAQADDLIPPPAAEPYKKNGGSAGVIALLDQILQDSKHMEKE